MLRDWFGIKQKVINEIINLTTLFVHEFQFAQCNDELVSTNYE